MTSAGITAPLAPITLGVAVALLLFGRRVFWLFVAGTGFLAGALFATTLFPGRSDLLALAVSLVAGVLGCLMALFVQRLAIGVAGFLAGACLGQAAIPLLPPGVAGWIPLLAGAVLGAVLMMVLFDWALRLLSSLLGAAVIAQALPIPSPWPTLAFLLLASAGIAFQARQPRKPRKPEPKQKPAA